MKTIRMQVPDDIITGYEPRRSCSLFWLFVLILFFWPGAILYYLIKKN